MKLYTKEQVTEALKSGYLNFFDDTNRLNLFAQEYISKLTPIELPSEDEIKNKMHRYNITDFGQMAAFQVGAKWVIEQIKNQQQ